MRSEHRPDRGFSLVELLVAIVVLGVLSTVTVFAVRGITDRSQSSACSAELRTLRSATESYFAKHVGTGGTIATQAYGADTGYPGNASSPAISPPAGVTAGATPAATLVNAGLLRSTPTMLWVQPNAQIVVAKSACGTVGQPAGGDSVAATATTIAVPTTPAPAPSYLLDQVAVSPVAAYSLRRLDADYAGSAIRVRRSSDSTQLDIGFTPAGDLDTAALTAFVGAGDGFVVTHYDQSGNGRHAVQASAANQPRVVIGGSVVTINSKPAIDTAVNRGLLSAASASFTIGGVMGVVRSATTNWSQFHAVATADGSRNGTLMNSGTATMHGNVLPTALRRNGVVLATNASLAPITSPMLIDIDTAGPSVSRTRVGFGNYDVGLAGGAGVQAEAIVFATPLSAANRTALSTNLAAYYGITI